MAFKKFKPKNFEDFEILGGDGKKLCDIRIKPSGILCSPKGEHDWYAMGIAEFIALMKSQGKKQKK